MNIKTLTFAFIATFVFSGCASTAKTDGETATEEATAANDAEIAQQTTAVQDTEVDPDEVTCKRIAKIGTRVKTKMCATNREWKEVERRAQQTTEQYQREAAATTRNDSG